MNWNVFRELPPMERMRRRRLRTPFEKNLVSWLKRISELDTDSPRFCDRFIHLILQHDPNLDIDGRLVQTETVEFKGGSYPPLKDLYHAMLVRPDIMLGSIESDGSFQPGILPLVSALRRFSRFEHFGDPLDQILAFHPLCERSEDYAFKRWLSQDEVAAIAAKHGKPKCKTKDVDNRVRLWD